MKTLFRPALLVLFFVFLGFTQSFSQQQPARQKLIRANYKNAIGIKFVPFAVSYKNFQRFRNRAIEFLGDFSNGFRLTGLYQFHGDLNGTRNLKWYVGFGGHAGYYDNNRGSTGIMTGVDGVVGLDYKFLHAPLNIAIDWQPSYELITPGTEFQGGRGGIAVRFAF